VCGAVGISIRGVLGGILSVFIYYIASFVSETGSEVIQ
jgi:hypothetical protein